jgi:hypothetical protein
MGHYADEEISSNEYGGAACVFGQLASWGDNVGMCSNDGVKTMYLVGFHSRS